MKMKITPSVLAGSLDAIPSKSDFHRALICAALSKKESNIIIDNDMAERTVSQDIQATMNCLEAAGAKFIISGNEVRVSPIDKESVEDGLTVDCDESGSTLRFILPVLGALGKEFKVVGHGRLPERPIKELVDQMKSHGCRFSGDTIPFTVSGKLEAGEYELPGNVSSQYISGLLFALPLLDDDSSISITTEIESASYIDMTMRTLDKYNVKTSLIGKEFGICGGQKYDISEEYRIEGDWSNSAFWLCAGALSDTGITCRGLDLKSMQPDRKLYEILGDIGADIRSKNGKISVKKNRLDGITVDGSEIPDLVPVLSVVLSVCKGNSRIINAGRLRIKESDRLSAISENLKILGAQIEETENGLVITGVKNLKGGIVNGFNDHRIVMAMAIAGLICDDEIIIEGSEAVNKSYKNFFDDFKKLGGKVNGI